MNEGVMGQTSVKKVELMLKSEDSLTVRILRYEIEKGLRTV